MMIDHQNLIEHQSAYPYHSCKCAIGRANILADSVNPLQSLNGGWKAMISNLCVWTILVIFFASGPLARGTPLGSLASPGDTVSSAATTCQSQSASNSVDGVSEISRDSLSRHAIFDRILTREPDNDVMARALDLLKQRGAHRCWHKHSVFLDHLMGVSGILHLWNPHDELLRLVGLFHSAYSNSYVNLALLDPATERGLLSDIIGQPAEDVVFLFCSVDRQEIIVNTLLKQGYIPSEGLTVRSIRGGEDVHLSSELLFRLVVFTMADIADQYFGWQDELFGGGGTAGSMIIPGEDLVERHRSTALWPGVSKPGLWMSYVSQLAQVAATYSNSSLSNLPPVFDFGRQLLTVENDAKACDLYWSVVTSAVTADEVDATLQACIEANPWAFEPLVLLAQTRLHADDFEGAVDAAAKALELQHNWGTAWDKRLPLGAWVAWTRVLLQQAKAQEPWPKNSWQVNNFGLVY